MHLSGGSFLQRMWLLIPLSFPAWTALTGSESPTELPRVEVSAHVPLRKVAEFQLEEGRFSPAAVADDHFIYIIGGVGANGETLDTIVRFDVRTGHTEHYAKLKHARYGPGAVLVGRKIYVLGGKATELPSISLISTPSASAELESPDDRFRNIRKAEISSSYHLYPGTRAGVVERSVEIIDLETGSVSAGPQLLQARADFGCVALGTWIFVIGGQEPPKAQRKAWTNRMEILDTIKGVWSETIPMPTPRAAPAAIIPGGYIAVSGGYNGATANDHLEVYDPRKSRWLELPHLCRTISAHSVVFLDRYLFAFGNYSAPEELMAYDFVTKGSAVFTLQYTPARQGAAVVLDGKIYVVSGVDVSGGKPLAIIQVFELTHRKT